MSTKTTHYMSRPDALTYIRDFGTLHLSNAQLADIVEILVADECMNFTVHDCMIDSALNRPRMLADGRILSVDAGRMEGEET